MTDTQGLVDYRLCIQWDDNQIGGFFGEYRWLSNFYYCPVEYAGYEFPSSEHAYQWAKLPVKHRLEKYDEVVTLTNFQVKKWGRDCPKDDRWDEIKYEAMYEIVLAKFYNNQDLADKLVETGDRTLIETNCWGDRYWGVTLDGIGENNLGKILMKVRNLCRFIHASNDGN